MIKFFRKIRQKLLQQNKVGSYFKYAIGEILLVVIGILIALSINNWNEAQKAKQSERVVLKNLIQDLRADSLAFNDNLDILSKINNLHQALYEIGVKGMDLEIEDPNLIRRLIYYNPIAIKNDPFVADKISNESIRKEINTYSRYLKDLDITYLEYAELLEKRVRVFLANNKVHQLANWFENKDSRIKEGTPFEFVDKAGLFLLSKSPEFQQLLLEVSIKTKNTASNIETVLIQNQNLKELIQKELKLK
ncbi:hypothetical protein SAMN00777080_1355 [Aquiflexum balticum DSM 16537]|uniref:Uncharacterized protein n=1 Tax=Aquiflexum balticum DSM 16537 TaxID=758820 RepID=A0A1W2H1H2_9BACT|nr:DUF6090 family protein [Aquiflexum balticum]SMD42790.1 hypothetical protein SAMN00777080_1355 [Aquiflexum balticum DSM 16537]